MNKVMESVNYCKDMKAKSLECKSKYSFTLSPKILFKLGENKDIIFKCKYQGIEAQVKIKLGKFPEIPLPDIEFSKKPGSNMKISMDFGEEHYDQIRIFIFRIPKEGYTDTNTKSLIKPGKDIED